VTEQAFSETLEALYCKSKPQRNSTSHRWNKFSSGHNAGGILVFLDGHSAAFKWDYVFNKAVSHRRKEVFNGDIWWNPNRISPEILGRLTVAAN
jgi:hypothetical protein